MRYSHTKLNKIGIITIGLVLSILAIYMGSVDSVEGLTTMYDLKSQGVPKLPANNKSTHLKRTYDALSSMRLRLIKSNDEYIKISLGDLRKAKAQKKAALVKQLEAKLAELKKDINSGLNVYDTGLTQYKADLKTVKNGGTLVQDAPRGSPPSGQTYVPPPVPPPPPPARAPPSLSGTTYVPPPAPGSNITNAAPHYPKYKYKGCWTHGHDTTYPIVNQMLFKDTPNMNNCVKKISELGLSVAAYDGNGICMGGDKEYQTQTSTDCSGTYPKKKSWLVYSKL